MTVLVVDTSTMRTVLNRLGNVGIAVMLASACACGLSPSQQFSINQWNIEAARLGHPEVRYVEYVDADTATALGFLPFGIAGFYVHRPGLAVSGFLWPVSLFWVPAVAHSSAIAYNYREFHAKVTSLREEAGARRQQTGS